MSKPTRAEYYAKRKPLIPAFNEVVVAITKKLLPNGFDTAKDAPDSLDGLIEHVNTTGRFCVYNGASDNTIFGNPSVNYAFRAWHDYWHYRKRLEFTEYGESLVAEQQKQDIVEMFGHNKLWLDLVDIEVNEQVSHYHKTGEFVKDQRQFTIDKLKERGYTI